MIGLVARLLLRRLLGAVPLVFAVVALTFFVIRLAPGDPAFILAGEAPTPEFLAQVRAENGLDRPVWQQFLAFLARAATGDFGMSIYASRPVFDGHTGSVFPRPPAGRGRDGSSPRSLGVLLGVAAAKRAGTRGDAAISALSLLGTSGPELLDRPAADPAVRRLARLVPGERHGRGPRARYTGFNHIWDVGMAHGPAGHDAGASTWSP